MQNFLLNGYFLQLLSGAWVTVKLALASVICGLLLGILFALAESARYRWLQKPISACIALLRGLPELLILFFIYFGISGLLSFFFKHYVNVSNFMIGVITLSLIFGAYASQIFRGAFASVPWGQVEAAKALGLTPARIWFAVKWPLAWRFAMPGLSNLWLVILKDTALVSLIGLAETMNQAQLAATSTAKPFLFYSGAALIYLVLTTFSQFVLNYLNHQAEKHLLIEH